MGNQELGWLGWLTASAVGIVIAVMMGRGPVPVNIPAELRLLTNAASSFRISGDNKDFLVRLKAAIEDAMHVEDNSVSYHIEKVEQRIERIVNASGPGSIAAGGDIRDSSISINATVQGLQDISELVGIVERAATVNAASLKKYLEIVQSHLAGGAKTKAEAKSAWAKFVEHIGSIAQTGTNVFDLVARIAALLG